MKDEHEKCNIIGDHIFILVTDDIDLLDVYSFSGSRI